MRKSVTVSGITAIALFILGLVAMLVLPDLPAWIASILFFGALSALVACFVWWFLGENKPVVPVTHNHYYAPLSEKLPQSRVVHEASGNLIGQESSLVGSIKVSSIFQSLYVGNFYASLADLTVKNCIEIGLVGYNPNKVNVTIEGLMGVLMAGSSNIRDMTIIPTPSIIAPVEAVAGKEFVLRLLLQLSPTLAEQFLTAIEASHVTLDLRRLQVIGLTQGDVRENVDLTLWDAITLRRRDDVVATRVHVLSVGMAVTSDEVTR